MFLKENKDGERSCCWDMKHTKKWGGWPRRRKEGRRRERERRKRQRAFAGMWEMAGFRGYVQRADICVFLTLGAPYLVLALKRPWKQALNQTHLRVVLKISETEQRGLLWETGQQPQAAGAKMVAGPLVQTIWKTPSREVEGFPKTLQTEFCTILTTEGMKPELIWFSQ